MIVFYKGDSFSFVVETDPEPGELISTVAIGCDRETSSTLRLELELEEFEEEVIQSDTLALVSKLCQLARKDLAVSGSLRSSP